MSSSPPLPTIPEFTPKPEVVLRELLALVIEERDALIAALADARAENEELKAAIKAQCVEGESA